MTPRRWPPTTCQHPSIDQRDLLVVWPSMCAVEEGDLTSITQGLVDHEGTGTLGRRRNVLPPGAESRVPSAPAVCRWCCCRRGGTARAGLF